MPPSFGPHQGVALLARPPWPSWWQTRQLLLYFSWALWSKATGSIKPALTGLPSSSLDRGDQGRIRLAPHAAAALPYSAAWPPSPDSSWPPGPGLRPRDSRRSGRDRCPSRPCWPGRDGRARTAGAPPVPGSCTSFAPCPGGNRGSSPPCPWRKRVFLVLFVVFVVATGAVVLIVLAAPGSAWSPCAGSAIPCSARRPA